MPSFLKYPPYDSAPPVPGSPWEEAGLELLAAEEALHTNPPAVSAAVARKEPIARVPRNWIGTGRDRRATDQITSILNDLIYRGRIARMSDGMWDIVLDESMVTDALGGTPLLEETFTVTAGTGINATVTNGNLNLTVDDSVLRTQTIAGGASVVFIPESVSDPVSNPSGGVYFWTNSSGELSARAETGIVTTVATV